MKKPIKDSKTLLFENMIKLNPDFKSKQILKEGYGMNEYNNLDYPVGADADPSAPWHQNDDEGPYEPEIPRVDTADFRLHGGIEDPGSYLYTVYETKPNSEFGNILMKVIPSDGAYTRNDKGIYGADFDDKEFAIMKQELTPYMNIKSISDFIKAAEKISSEMSEYEKEIDDYSGPSSRDYGSSYYDHYDNR
jgi:hypothetical protein